MQLIKFLFGTDPQLQRSGPPSDDDDFWYKKLSRNSNKAQVTTEEGALSIAAVYACVRVISESVASLPLILYQRRAEGGKERADGTPLSLLLRRKPNAWQTKTEFWEMMTAHVCLRGNAFAQKIYRGSRLEALWPLDPCKMKVQKGKNGLPVYLYDTDGQTFRLQFDEIFHIRGLSSDGLVGLSPIELHSMALAQSKSQDQYNTAFYDNMARPGGTLEHPGRLGDTAIKHLKESILEQYSGPSGAFKPMVLEEGMKWSTVGVSQRDSQFLESKNFSVTEIARIFRVPPHMIGDLTRATFSNIEQQSLDFVQNTLRPWLVRIEDAIWRDLIAAKDQENSFAEFLVDGMLRGDITSRYQAYSVGLNNGFLNADEVRAFENLNPVPEGAGKIFRIPLNTTPSNSDPEPVVEEPAAAAEDKSRDMSKYLRDIFCVGYARVVRRHVKKITANKDRTEAQLVLWLEEDARAAHTELCGVLRAMFEDECWNKKHKEPYEADLDKELRQLFVTHSNYYGAPELKAAEGNEESFARIRAEQLCDKITGAMAEHIKSKKGEAP